MPLISKAMWISAAEPSNSPASMRYFRILPFAFAVCGCLVSRAQQEVMVSQYMFNGLFLNPAYAGSHPYASASLLYRDQWTGITGAPVTSMLAVDGPLWNERMGVGFTLVHDQIGVSRDLEMAGQYAYRIRTGDNGQLAFGLKAGLSLYSAKLSDLVYWDQNDPLYQQNIRNVTVGKFGFGLYWHNDLSYAGISVPTIYAADGKIAEAAESVSDNYFQRHYYLYAGHIFEMSEDVDLKPSGLVKYHPQAPPEVDVNLNALYRERFWLGIGYRTGASVTGMVEYQVNPMFRIGYAYDMTTSALRRYSGASHEIMLGIDLGKEPVRIKTPRYF